MREAAPSHDGHRHIDIHVASVLLLKRQLVNELPRPSSSSPVELHTAAATPCTESRVRCPGVSSEEREGHALQPRLAWRALIGATLCCFSRVLEGVGDQLYVTSDKQELPENGLSNPRKVG
jgi:hypothetical protein